MPVTKSAKKKLRVDKKREKSNSRWEVKLKDLLKKARKAPTKESITAVFKLADKASKQNIIHKNKAARIKSTISKLLPKTEAKPKQTVARKKTATK